MSPTQTPVGWQFFSPARFILLLPRPGFAPSDPVNCSRSRFDVNSSKARNLSGDAIVAEDHQRDRLTSSSKAVGIQTDMDDDHIREDVDNGASSCVHLPENFLPVWGFMNRQQTGRYIFSKLLMAYPAEVRVPFGSMSLNMSAAEPASPSSALVVNHIHRFCTFKATRVSDFATMMCMYRRMMKRMREA